MSDRKLYRGQEIIWWKQNPQNPVNHLRIEATFLEYRGAQSALIGIRGRMKTVRLESLEPIQTKPALMRSGSFVA